jgi:hypothetical protein
MMTIKFGKCENSKISEGWVEAPKLFSNSKFEYLTTIFFSIIIMELFEFFSPTLSVFSKLYLLFLLIPLHEIIHILFGRDIRKSEIWISIKPLIIYVVSDSLYTKLRLVVVLIMPFVILTVIPILISVLFNNILFLYIAYYNAIGSGGDFISIMRILILKNNEFMLINGELYQKEAKIEACD